MKLEQQVCSYELSRKLQLLLSKQDNLYKYVEFNGFYEILTKDEFEKSLIEEKDSIEDIVDTFTSPELGELLPDGYKTFRENNEWVCSFIDEKEYKRTSKADTEANARAKMLIYLLENEVIRL